MRPLLPSRRPRAPFLRPSGDPAAAASQGAPVEATPQPVATGLRPLAVDAGGRPARVVLVRTVHTSTGLPRSWPSFDALVAALRRINFTDTGSVGWVGPYPRVVRRAIPGGFETNVAWLHRLNPDAARYADSQIAAAQRRLAQQVGEALVAITGGTSAESVRQWADVTVDPHNEVNHGPVTWWESGYAARTRTRDHEPTLTEIDAQENAIGPDAADLQNPDYLTWLRGQGLGGFSWGLVLGGAAVFGGALYALAKMGGGSREVVIRADSVRRRARGA